MNTETYQAQIEHENIVVPFHKNLEQKFNEICIAFNQDNEEHPQSCFFVRMWRYACYAYEEYAQSSDEILECTKSSLLKIRDEYISKFTEFMKIPHPPVLVRQVAAMKIDD